MSYDVIEASVQDGSPIYKYLFTQGSTEYRYTTAAFFVSDSTGTWEPVALNASSIKQTGELAKNGTSLAFPRDNALIQTFLGKSPEVKTSLTIYRGHQPSDLSEYQIFWKGRVASSEADGDQVVLECEDIFTSFRRPGLRAKYQKGCRHALYSTDCGANENDFAVSATLLSQDGFAVTIQIDSDSNIDSNSAVFNDGYFSLGSVETSDGVRRHIERHAGTTLTLSRAFDGLDIDSNGVSVTLYPGCNRTTEDCKDKFNNLLNHGGFPYLPSKNPFVGNVQGSVV